ncbi:MAG: hypothetical protein EOP05_00860, partial [Proteobacteria bacterium]
MNPPKFMKWIFAAILLITVGVSQPARASFVYMPIKVRSEVRGVTLVVHGLNLKPSKMQELSNQLTSMKQDVVLVTLAGNGEDEKEFGEVTRERWLHDVFEAYEAATRKAKAQGVPVQFLGFSVGGLLGVDLVASGKAQ